MIGSAKPCWFMAGYNEMLLRIEPEKTICYNVALSGNAGRHCICGLRPQFLEIHELRTVIQSG